MKFMELLKLHWIGRDGVEGKTQIFREDHEIIVKSGVNSTTFGYLS